MTPPQRLLLLTAALCWLGATEAYWRPPQLPTGRVCPINDQGRYCNFGPDNPPQHTCSTDAECKATEKCCFYGCGRQCTSTCPSPCPLGQQCVIPELNGGGGQYSFRVWGEATCR